MYITLSYAQSREMCDCVEAILVPSGDRIKDLVEEIFEVQQLGLTMVCIFIMTS